MLVSAIYAFDHCRLSFSLSRLDVLLLPIYRFYFFFEVLGLFGIIPMLNLSNQTLANSLHIVPSSSHYRHLTPSSNDLDEENKTSGLAGFDKNHERGE